MSEELPEYGLFGAFGYNKKTKQHYDAIMFTRQCPFRNCQRFLWIVREREPGSGGYCIGSEGVNDE